MKINLTQFNVISACFLLHSCGQAPKQSISVNSLPSPIAYEQKMTINPSEGSPTDYFIFESTNKTKSIRKVTAPASHPPLGDFSKLIDYYKTSSNKNRKNNFSFSNIQENEIQNENTSIISSYLYCKYNAEIKLSDDATINQIGGMWAIQEKPNKPCVFCNPMKYDWIKINGTRNSDGSFQTNYTTQELTLACENTLKLNAKLKLTLNNLNNPKPINLTFLNYSESTSDVDFARPIRTLNELQESKFKNLVTFGDSLSDIGNDLRRTAGLFPSAAYWGGRFSNGYNWADYLSKLLHLSHYSWAFGGAQSGTPTALGIVSSLTSQVNDYITNKGQTCIGLICKIYGGYGDPKHTLFSVLIGANNYFGFKSYIPNSNLESKELGHLTFEIGSGNFKQTLIDDDFIQKTIYEDMQLSIEKLINEVQAETILIPNLPQLASIPGQAPDHLEKTKNLSSQLATQANLKMKDVVLTHNSELKKMISHLKNKYPNITFISLDMQSAFERIIKNPENYQSYSNTFVQKLNTPEEYQSLKNINSPCYENFVSTADIEKSIIKNAELEKIFEKIGNIFGYPSDAYTSNYFTDLSLSNLCVDPENHLFYDNVHPTTQVHNMLAYALYKFINENFSNKINP